MSLGAKPEVARIVLWSERSAEVMIFTLYVHVDAAITFNISSMFLPLVGVETRITGPVRAATSATFSLLKSLPIMTSGSARVFLQAKPRCNPGHMHGSHA